MTSGSDASKKISQTSYSSSKESWKQTIINLLLWVLSLSITYHLHITKQLFEYFNILCSHEVLIKHHRQNFIASLDEQVRGTGCYEILELIHNLISNMYGQLFPFNRCLVPIFHLDQVKNFGPIIMLLIFFALSSKFVIVISGNRVYVNVQHNDK